MAADSARRASPQSPGRRRARERGLSGLLVAGLAFAATVAAGLYVVGLVRDFGANEAAVIQAVGAPR